MPLPKWCQFCVGINMLIGSFSVSWVISSSIYGFMITWWETIYLINMVLLPIALKSFKQNLGIYLKNAFKNLTAKRYLVLVMCVGLLNCLWLSNFWFWSNIRIFIQWTLHLIMVHCVVSWPAVFSGWVITNWWVNSLRPSDAYMRQ